MKKFLTLVVIVLLILIVLVLFFPKNHQEPVTRIDLTETEAELLDWYDSLGYPELTELPIVAVTTGRWTQIDDDTPKNQFALGFLTQEVGNEFSVFGLDGVLESYTRTPATTAHDEMVFYEKRNLKQVAEEQLERIKNIDPHDHMRRSGSQTTEAFEIVVLARGCAAKGLIDETQRLLEIANSTKDQLIGVGAEGTTLIERLKLEHAHTRMWRAVVEFGDANISRPELLKKFEYIIEHFPQSEYCERATETILLLKQMIAEDEEHAKQAKSLDEIKGDELVAELIFRLRDHNVDQFSPPSQHDLLNGESYEQSPADRLVAMEFEGVPLLIEAIEDQTFTRSVICHRDYYFSHDVLTVGDCVHSILARIAGKRFYSNGEMAKNGQPKSTKELATEWWYEVKTKGEKAVLIEATQSGDRDSRYQVQMLAEKYPEEAVAAIEVGISKSEWWGREEMIRLLSKLGDEVAIDLIKTQLTTAPRLSTRIAAANALMDHGDSLAAVEAMLSEWEGRKTPISESSFSVDDPTPSLAVCLLRSNSIQGIEVVGKSFDELESDTKHEIVRSLFDINFGSNECRDAIEKFLVDCLLIIDERVGTNGSINGQSYSDPRICDWAGCVLAFHWPQSYDFRLDGSEKERDVSRYAAINKWRDAHGHEPLDTPSPFEIEILPFEKTNPLIEQVKSSKTESEGETAFSELLKLGPGAIGAVEKLTRILNKSHPFFGKANELFVNMPNTITVIKFNTNSAKVTEEWNKKIKSFQGKHLTSELIIEHLTEFTMTRPYPGITFKAVRDGEGNGVEFEVSLISEPATRSGTKQVWNIRKNIKLGKKSLMNSVGGYDLEYATTKETFNDLQTNLDNALAEPDVYMKVFVSLIIDK